MRNFTALRRKVWLLLVSLLTVAMMCAGISIQFREKVSAPFFLTESGFYESAFYLEIDVPEGCSVYYTLDSSIPDRNATRYTGPIYIDNATLNENTYSMIEEVAVSDWEIKAPDFLVDKCTVIRAVAIPDAIWNSQSSQVITKSYFVGLPPEQYDQCGIISLVTDSKNLFDSKTGIYVTGDTLEDYLSRTANPEEVPWAYWPANFTQRGREWEREASATFWDPEGRMLLEKDIGIRVQGGWSRSYVPRSLNFYAREEYDDVPYFEFDFFSNGKQPEIMTLSAGGSAGFLNQVPNYLMSVCASNLPCSVAEHKPYVLFLDGEYWGFYWLMEKFDSTYLQQTYELGDSDVIFIKNTELEEGYEEDFFVYKQMIQFFANNDMSHEPNYQKACELIDINSFVDYYATMIYVARSSDWPGHNELLWRTREVSDSPYADGKWRWMIYDTSGFCYDHTGYDHNTLEWVLQESTIFRSLWNNPDFQIMFKTRLFEIADQYFDAQKMTLFLTDYEETMFSPLSRNWDRFWGKESVRSDEFWLTMSNMKDFFTRRRDVVASWFA